MALIKAKSLCKDYFEKAKENRIIEVLKDINLIINEGEFVIITGPSGSGKTTLLYLLSNLESPSYGEILFNNKKYSDFSKVEETHFRQNQMGFVFQSYQLFPTLSVYDNIALPLVIKKEKFTKEQIFDLMKLVGIEQLHKSFPDQLSGGEKQRVAIARSIVVQPRVVFADEPTGNLDKEKSEEIMAIFQRINQEKGTTIILVTHNLSHLKYATRIIELSNSTIIRNEVIRDV